MKDWDDMRFFHAVAEGGSLSAASRSLGVNHSTVFRRINQLEERLQTRLFDRLDNRYQLTDLGQQLYARVRQVADVMDDVERQVAGRDTLLEGSIRLTCPDTFLDWIVPGLIANFCRQYPQITVELRADQEHLDLARREADIALRATNSPPDYLIGKRLGQMGWGFYGLPSLGELSAVLPAAAAAPVIAPAPALCAPLPHWRGRVWVWRCCPASLQKGLSSLPRRAKTLIPVSGFCITRICGRTRA